jgi:hypothetical protein
VSIHRLLTGNGFQRRRFLSFHVHWLLFTLAGGYLTLQLDVAWSQPSNKGYSSLLMAHELQSFTAVSIILTGFGRSVKLLMAFASTVIRGFNFLEVHKRDFYSL